MIMIDWDGSRINISFLFPDPDLFLTRHSCIENNACRMEATLWSKGDAANENIDDGDSGMFSDVLIFHNVDMRTSSELTINTG